MPKICMTLLLAMAILGSAMGTQDAPAAAPPTQPAGAPSRNVKEVQRDTEWIAGVPSRVVGSDGSKQINQKLLEAIEEIDRASNDGLHIWKHEFDVVVPRTTKAELKVGTGDNRVTHKVHPLWPAAVRLHSTPPDGIQGRLVYIGSATLAEMPAKSLGGQIAVMEMSAGRQWRRAFEAGAKALILLGDPKTDQSDASSHLLPLPVYLPRFYVPEGKLAAKLRDKAIPEGTLVCESRWESVQARNIYALVKPKPAAYGRKALAICVPIDSMSVVPDLAPGADAAVDAALGLRLLRHFTAAAPDRPVLVAFMDAQSINMLGFRQMVGALSVTEEERLDSLYEDDAILKEYREAWDLLQSLKNPAAPPTDLHEPEYAILHAYLRDEVDKVVVAADTELQSLRVKEQTQEVLDKIEKIKKNRIDHRGTQASLLSGRPLPAGRKALAEKVWGLARDRAIGQYERADAIAKASERRRQIRNELTAALHLSPTEEDDEATTRPIAFMLGVDLSDAGVCVGPSLYCRFLIGSQGDNGKVFKTWVESTIGKDLKKVWKDPAQRRAVNIQPFSDLSSDDTHVQGEPAVLTPSASFQTYSITWATLNGPRRRVDTPFDRTDRLNWSRLGPQIDATVTMIDALAGASDEDFDTESRPSKSPDWVRVRTMTVDVSPGTPVPRLPMEGYLTTLVPGPFNTDGFLPAGWPMAAGMRRYEFRFTGPDGRALFDFIPRRSRSWLEGFHLESYKLEKDANGTQRAITRAIDLRRAGRGVKLHDNFGYGYKNKTPFRGVVFSCAELTVTGLNDPRYLMPLPAGSILDARSQSAPKRMNMMFHDGMLSCLLEQKVQWQLVLRAGITRNRMALLNIKDPDANPGESIRNLIEGFRIGEPLPAGPLFQAAQDWHHLNARRIADYAAAGITSTSLADMHDDAGEALDEAKGRYDADDGAGFHRAAGQAMATEARVYQALLDTANDVIRGAVLLLLLLVPFAVVMERLAVAASKIVHQIVATLIIFVAMTGVLWSFHPAFKISSQPLTVIMAFGIIFMSLLVIVLVIRKFESELAKLRSGRAESSSAKTSRLGVLSTAIRLGIANMRRRKLRTVLTGMTVVLITFALLCFVSTSQYVGYRQYALDENAAFTGVLIRQAGSRPLPPDTLEAVRNCLVGGVDGIETNHVVGRIWWSRASNQWRLNAINPATGKHMEFVTALGLDPHEAEISGIDAILESNWEEFAAGTGCYLSPQSARELGVQPGGTVVVAGMDLKLLGTFDGNRFDQEAHDLDGHSLAPLDYSSMTADELTQSKQSTLALMAAAEEAGAAASEQDLRATPGISLLVLPQQMLEGQRDCTLQSVAIRADDAKQARTVAERLADRFAFTVLYGVKDEPLQVLASTPLLPSAPKSLLIPLIIGASIIFNTMLSSIAERRREVYIYTSLGLAPIHVGFLFLAEAMTYGLMGSVFGYVVGQGAATALDSLGWLGGMTLNYSGSQAIMIMFMVLAVVMVAALIPAYLAGRMAAPSNKRTWSVPQPVDGVIRDTLPFTVNAKTANGVSAYLLEYLDAHAEGSIGRFSTDKLQTFRKSVDGLEAMGIDCTVWLAPYDLGIRQEVRLTVEPTEGKDIYGIHLELRRQAGAERTWRRLNRVFLGDLRRQLLGWRRLEPERILEFLAQGRESLAAMPWLGQEDAAGT